MAIMKYRFWKIDLMKCKHVAMIYKSCRTLYVPHKLYQSANENLDNFGFLRIIFADHRLKEYQGEPNRKI